MVTSPGFKWWLSQEGHESFHVWYPLNRTVQSRTLDRYCFCCTAGTRHILLSPGTPLGNFLLGLWLLCCEIQATSIIRSTMLNMNWINRSQHFLHIELRVKIQWNEPKRITWKAPNFVQHAAWYVIMRVWQFRCESTKLLSIPQGLRIHLNQGVHGGPSNRCWRASRPPTSIWTAGPSRHSGRQNIFLLYSTKHLFFIAGHFDKVQKCTFL